MTPDPVAEIARRVGLAEPLYFSRRFRALWGLSPTAHRRGVGRAEDGLLIRTAPPDTP